MRLRPRSETGAAAVEFAIIVPFLCFLLFAIISYGYMLSFRQALSQAAAEGARAAAVAPASLPATPVPPDPDSVETRAIAAVNEGLGSYGVTCDDDGKLRHGSADAGTCEVSLPAAPCTGSQVGATCVKVTLSYTYSDDPLLPKFPGLGVVLPNTLTYSVEAEVS
jgi:Flp pilus assembly pilin Flp